jgi:hypothetical protein
MALLAAGRGVCTAQEIAPFRVTGVEGHAGVRSVRDELTSEQGGSALGSGRTRQAQSDLREEVFVMTHSYAYHPNLVTFDVGGGPILQRGRFATESGETQSGDVLYNFTGRATFLRDKPYQASLFFDHLNPTLSIAPGEVLTQENTQYGMSVAVLEPVTPLPMHLNASRSHFKGVGAGRVVDDQIERVSVNASRSYGRIGSSNFQIQSIRQESQSGSPNLAIQASSSDTQSVNVDTRLQFGADRQYELTNLVSHSTQAYTLESGSLPERKDTRVLFDLRGRHSDKLQSFAQLNYSSSVQGDSSYTLNSAAAGMTFRPVPDLAAGLGVRGEDSSTGPASVRSRGVDASLHYQRPLPFGAVQASYLARYDQREQRSSAPSTNIIGERATLAGTSVVPLARMHVIPGSVVVTNATRTQTFSEGRDYQLTSLGVETRLQRLVGGAIVDGQEVLIDYAFDLGGTFSYTQRDQTASLNWGFARYFNLYVRRYDSLPHLTEGEPSFPLNEIRSTLYGARTDVPLRWYVEAAVGWSFEHETRHETIAPYRRQAAEAYAQSQDPFFATGHLRIATRRVQVDYENSLQDIELHGWDLRYWVRFWGVELSADAGYEIDTGAPVTRRRSIAAARAQWRYRKLALSLELGRTHEVQGELETRRLQVQMLGRRDF